MSDELSTPSAPDDPSLFLALVNRERARNNPPLPPLTWDQWLVKSPDERIPRPGVFVLNYPGRSYSAAFEAMWRSPKGQRAILNRSVKRLAVWRDSEKDGPGITAIIE